MGICQHRRTPAVVVNVQSVPAPPPAPPAPTPVPEAVPPPPPQRSARDHRQQALQDLFDASFHKCATTNKLHIKGYCASSSKATAKMEICQHCRKKYLAEDAANQPEDEED